MVEQLVVPEIVMGRNQIELAVKIITMGIWKTIITEIERVIVEIEVVDL